MQQWIAATPAVVFSYLTIPEKFVMWMGVRGQLDPRPGGRFRVEVDGAHVASGEYREVNPPRRLVMTWGWESDPDVPPGSTVVEITLEPEGSGTSMLLRHHGLATDDQRTSHNKGWILYAGALRDLFM